MRVTDFLPLIILAAVLAAFFGHWAFEWHRSSPSEREKARRAMDDIHTM
jgi:hypothetical protein